MTTRFTDELMEQGLTYKVLTLVSQIDVNNEFEKLQRERGLGSEKHRKEARVLYNDLMGIFVKYETFILSMQKKILRCIIIIATFFMIHLFYFVCIEHFLTCMSL